MSADAGLRARRRRPRQRQPHRLAEHTQAEPEARRLARAGRSQLDLVGGEGRQLHVERGLAKLQLHPGLGFAKASQPERQRVIGDARHEGQAQAPAAFEQPRTAAAALRPPARRAWSTRAWPAAVNLTARALEQTTPRPFQAARPVSTAAGHRQTHGGSTEVQFFGDGNELAQHPQLITDSPAYQLTMIIY
jgi:hypothetical protein